MDVNRDSMCVLPGVSGASVGHAVEKKQPGG